MSEQDHDLHGMVGAYVADALDDDQRTLFEAHLSGCESCRRESAEFAETLGELTWLVETAPPPALRSSILAEIATVRPLPPEQPEERPEDPEVPRPAKTAPAETTIPRPWPADVPPVTPSDDPAHYDAANQVDELAVRRQRRVRRAMIGLVAAALVLVVGLGGWVGSLVNDDRQQQVATQQLNDLLTAPDATIYSTHLNGAPVSFVVSKQRNQALFMGEHVGAPATDSVYQLWMVKGTTATPNATIDHGGSVSQWMHTGPLDEADTLAITIEPRGGSATPTVPIAAAVKL